MSVESVDLSSERKAADAEKAVGVSVKRDNVNRLTRSESSQVVVVGDADGASVARSDAGRGANQRHLALEAVF